MNNYCGFIEVWKNELGFTYQTMHNCYEHLASSLSCNDDYFNTVTVAIFKIKLDGGYNKTKN